MDEETRKKLAEWNKLVGNTTPLKPKGEISSAQNLDSQSAQNKDPEETPPDANTRAATPGKEKKPDISPIQEVENKRAAEHQSTLKRIRTYESDVAENITKRKASLSSMVMAESKKARAAEDEEVDNERKLGTAFLSIFLSIILIAGGLGALGAWFYFSNEDDPNQENSFSGSFLQTNKEEVHILDAPKREDILLKLDEIKSTVSVRDSEIYVPIFSKQIGAELPEEEDRIVALSIREFLEALSVRAPLSLYRSLEPNFVLGMWQGQEKEFFLVIKTTFFQNAFASMLSWEGDLADDLSFIATNHTVEISSEPNVEDEAAATTTTSGAESGLATSSANSETNASSEDDTNTETASQEVFEFEDLSEEIPAVEAEFEDEVLFNHDARVLRDDDGEIRILYTFPNENTLIIAGSREALEDILDRLNVREFES